MLISAQVLGGPTAEGLGVGGLEVQQQVELGAGLLPVAALGEGLDAVAVLEPDVEQDDVEVIPAKEVARLGDRRAVGDNLELDNVTEMVQSRYRSSRSRQFFIERFGPRVGPMLWRVGRAGLLGRTWQRYADGGDDASGAVASGYTA